MRAFLYSLLMTDTSDHMLSLSMDTIIHRPQVAPIKARARRRSSLRGLRMMGRMVTMMKGGRVTRRKRITINILLKAYQVRIMRVRWCLGCQLTFVISGKHSMKKDDYLTTIMQVPPKQRIAITPFDQKTQREAFSVSLEGLKGVRHSANHFFTTI